MSLNAATSFLTLFLTLGLSSFILLDGYKNKVNRYFFLLGMSIVLWIGSNMLADFYNDYSRALFFSRLSIIWAPLFPIFLNGLIANLYYSNDKKFIKNYKLISIISIIVTTAIIFLSQTSLNIENLVIQSWGLEYQPGKLYYLLFMYLLIAFSFSFFYLFRVYNISNDPQKSQARFMITGSFLAIFFSVLMSIIFPLLGYSSLSIFGPPTVLFFVGFTAIAILKHHLFNIKVIATELIVFSLWIFILIRVLIADNIQETIIEASLLVVMMVIGIFLIRSVIKEVDQREKIEKLAVDLQKANDRLKDVDRQKSEFVSFATHQLRAPLTAMKGYTSLLLEDEMGTIPPEARVAISRIYESANTLTAIVDDYLNVTRIELGSIKYTFDTINLKDLVQNVVAELKPNIDKATNVRFVVDIKDTDSEADYNMTADKDKLKQVIANLVDNSIKYTPKGTVNVSLVPDKKAHKLIFKVQDTGIGISAEILPKLFQKWSRSESANKTNIKGTGLGLYVAKEIIKTHHGAIHAESLGEGKGSTFIVELQPLAKM